MNKKQIFIGLGVLAVAVIGVIIYKRREEKKSGVSGVTKHKIKDKQTGKVTYTY